MIKKAPTLQDVAERAGVSRMAVSAVINNKQSTVRVSEATRERIFVAMADLRYQPDAAARSLRLQKTDTIGFYNGHGYIDLLDPFAPNIFLGLQSAAAHHSNHLLLYNGFHLQDEAAIVGKVLSNKADGVVVWPSTNDAGLIAKLGDTGKPIIQLAEAYTGAPAVITDDYDCARQIAEHLADRGHKSIHFRRRLTPLRTEAARYEAFRDVAAERGLTLTTSLPADRVDTLTDYEKDLIRNHAGPSGFTAVACWHDAAASTVMKYCRQEGINVPGDLALTGYDGFPWAIPDERELLTTVYVDWQQVAASCVELLIERVAGREIAERTVISGTVQIGTTS